MYRTIRLSLYIFIVVSLIGCAVKPMKISPVLDIVQIHNINQDQKFKYTFIDGRRDDFKFKRSFLFRNEFGAPEFACGDLRYDIKLFDLFKQVVQRELPENVDSPYEVEMNLKAFHVLEKIPAFGFAKPNFIGIMKVDVAVLGEDKKFVFQKTYQYEISNSRWAWTVEAEKTGISKGLSSLLDQFIAEFSRDLGRIPIARSCEHQ